MLETLFSHLATWWQRHDAITRLRSLDDRLLADMGTKRDDIACFVSDHQQC